MGLSKEFPAHGFPDGLPEEEAVVEQLVVSSPEGLGPSAIGAWVQSAGFSEAFWGVGKNGAWRSRLPR